MITDTIKRKKKDLGIFYTPEVVVEFIFDVLNMLKQKDDEDHSRWDKRKPKPHYPSVIDPAVGEGVFLKKALESGFTKPKYVFGIDIDESAKQRWEEINLLKSFKSRAELDKHFFHQNGLLPLDGNQVLRYKKGGLTEFDVVVGNPPYGGIGVDFKGSLTPENEKLLEALESYEIIWHRKKRNHKEKDKNQSTLFSSEQPQTTMRFEKKDIIKLAQSLPVEILFVNRFIQLAKPNGWISIIIPDGILANSNLHYVREFVTHQAKVLGIVSLPRGTFKHAGTNAKTSILFLQRYGSEIPLNDSRNLNYSVFLTSINKLEKKYFDIIINSFEEFLYYDKIT